MKWNDRVVARRISSCSRRRTPSARSTTSSWTVVEAKLEIFVKLLRKSLKEMGELKKFQSSTFDAIARRKISRRSRYYSGTYWQDSGTTEWSSLCEWFKRFWRCWISTQWTIHVSSRPVSFPLHPIPGGMLSRSKGMPSRKDGPPCNWDTQGISRNVFASPVV